MTKEKGMGFIDIHSHVLYGVDDGARDIEESLAIIETAWASGVKAIVATPHVIMERNDDLLNRVCNTFEILKERVVQQGIGIDLILGAEVFLEPELPVRVKRDKRLTINGMGRFVLVELPLFEIPIYTSSVFFGLLTQGITPIWAHPERCHAVIEDYERVCPFIGNGVMVQLNAGSLLGFYGRRVRSIAFTLLKKGLVHIMAGDVHNLNKGHFPMIEGFELVMKTLGRQRAIDITWSIPKLVINGSDIPPLSA